MDTTTNTPPADHSRLVEDALDAFWDVVVEAYPLAESGDLSPASTFRLQEAAEAAVTEWVANNAYRVPAKSACLGCPYHSDATWRAMKRDRPAEWADTVALDRVIRQGLPGVKGEAFLHRSLVPLDVVDLTTDEGRGQLRLPGFDDECSGHSGV